jgi:hypothetical protein
MRNDIYSNLTAAQKTMLKSLGKKGWKFQDGYWESHHNGTPYYDVEFKSPSMENFRSIGEHEWPKVTLDYLLEREATSVASDWTDTVFSRNSTVTTPIAQSLKEYFLKKHTTEFLKLYSEAVNVDVSISNTIKNNKPTKVKVTIEIL